MKLIPLAKSADLAQVERVREFVDGRSCVIVGSAPLPTQFADVQPYETTIAVNGGISSLPAVADIWVVGSKSHDQHLTTARPLHRLMLEQAKQRRVGHLVLLRGPKVASEQSTLEVLASFRCRHATWSVLDKPTKRWMEGEYCARAADKQPCSSGILAAAIALYCGAAHVRLVGFSLKPGYHYTNERPQSWWRDHIEADKRALIALRARFGERLVGDCMAVAA